MLNSLSVLKRFYFFIFCANSIRTKQGCNDRPTKYTFHFDSWFWFCNALRYSFAKLLMHCRQVESWSKQTKYGHDACMHLIVTFSGMLQPWWKPFLPIYQHIPHSSRLYAITNGACSTDRTIMPRTNPNAHHDNLMNLLEIRVHFEHHTNAHIFRVGRL